MRGKITKHAVENLTPGTRDQFLWDTEVAGFGCKVTPAGKRSYIFQYRPRTQAKKNRTAPKRITIGYHGETTAHEARGKAAKLLVNVRAGENPGLVRQPSELPTVEQLGERFLNEHLPNKKKPPRQSTIDSYESIFRNHVVPRLGAKHVNEVTTRDLERLHSAMRKTPYIANRTLSCLQQAFDQAERWGWREQHTNPALHIDKYPEDRRGTKKEVMLSPEQMAQLLTAIDEEEKRGTDPVACNAIRMAFWTGWRIGEVLALRWENVDQERGIARLLKTKASEEEYRQVPAKALEVISTQEKVIGCPFVFPGRVPNHLTHVRKPWKKIIKRAGLDDLQGLGSLRLHDLRHNVVSWDVSRGVPLEIAGKSVGHRSRRSTEVYAHFAPDAIKRATDARAEAMEAAILNKPTG